MRYFIGFLVSIGLIILVFILVLKGFSGDGAKQSKTSLVDYANTAVQMRLTVDGPIVADQEHNVYRITVGRDETTIETFKGYESTLINFQHYDNNPVGYANFLRALDVAGYTKGITGPGAQKDERGICAIGDRYVMEINNGSSRRMQRFWSTNCRGQGTFKGNAQEVRRLFRVQIPPADMSKLTGSLNL
jgi:hypothetical protein